MLVHCYTFIVSVCFGSISIFLFTGFVVIAVLHGTSLSYNGPTILEKLRDYLQRPQELAQRWMRIIA